MSVLDTLPRLSLLIRYSGVLLAMDPCGPLLGPHWFNSLFLQSHFFVKKDALTLAEAVTQVVDTRDSAANRAAVDRG